jgi:hypothetical protein
MFRRRAKRVQGEQWLTQYGNRRRPIDGRAFKNRPPEPGVVNALSLNLGRQSVREAAAAVQTGRVGPSQGSGVRYTTAARLEQAGFVARHTGNNRNPLHVSVTCLDENRTWTDDDSERFDACFEEPAWGEG